ncbi:MAG: amidohydrolase family protein, partial [Eudoraea sp.]|nr:amidohydrolase family protein [Eudoraea sp.]
MKHSHFKAISKLVFLVLFPSISLSQYLLVPDHVFDGQTMHQNWVVLVEGNKITFAGSPGQLVKPASTEEIRMEGTTLLPGIIEGHSHLLLHPYNETS